MRKITMEDIKDLETKLEINHMSTKECGVLDFTTIVKNWVREILIDGPDNEEIPLQSQLGTYLDLVNNMVIKNSFGRKYLSAADQINAALEYAVHLIEDSLEEYAKRTSDKRTTMNKINTIIHEFNGTTGASAN